MSVRLICLLGAMGMASAQRVGAPTDDLTNLSVEDLRSLKRTPIIALTAHASKSQHDECIAQGMDAVVTKPVDVKTLMEAAVILLRDAPLALRN